MELGAFSISLNVKNIEKSLKFYERLGFEKLGGDISEKWLILRNAKHQIGLFEGMLTQNTMTFNPGWDQLTNSLENFDDIKNIREKLLKNGIVPEFCPNGYKAEESHLMLSDPDGNMILIDQHC
tara:strand:- start:1330 stop:1701 length:372 start_codon:yes stop_codon:yes gene_type:complete